MRLGYARVSTEDQNLDGQCQCLSAAGCEKLFEEKISGATRNRPKLEALIEHLRKDDILVRGQCGTTLLCPVNVPTVSGMARDGTIEIQVTAEERAVIYGAGERDQRTVSDYVRVAALERARRTAPVQR
jgi:hypothetical protein